MNQDWSRLNHHDSDIDVNNNSIKSTRINNYEDGHLGYCKEGRKEVGRRQEGGQEEGSKRTSRRKKLTKRN